VTEPGVPKPVHKPNPTLIALLVGVAILILVIAFFATNRNPNQDKLTDNELVETAPAASPAKRCAAATTYDMIKRDLFRRASEMRGSDQAAYDKLAAYAVLRMENPVLESESSDTGAINCSGTLSLDLPPGVTVVGGRRTLTADVDYSIQPAADGSGDVVLLKNADAIVTPLATLTRVAQSTVQPAAPIETGEVASPAAPATAPTAPQSASATPPPAAAPRTSSRPSFDCANARTSGEVAVCSDGRLAAMDVRMAGQYRSALADATPAQRALLRSTRDRFLAFRDRCPDRPCMANTYSGRMREIRDIMEGRWQPSR
jgi:uncharacterized protein YecT (DUF1311 family)